MKKVNTDYELLSNYINFKDAVIADIGCGIGDLVREISLQGAIITGVDISEMIKKAERNPKEKEERYLSGCGEQLPFNDNYANFLIYGASFHHIPYSLMNQALKECNRVLKPKGKAIFIEPIAKKNSYYEIIKLIEDESGIQNFAYKKLKDLDGTGLTFLNEEIYYFERSFQDYINLINVFIDDENKKKIIIDQASKKTLRFSEFAGKNFDNFTYKSIVRLIVLEKQEQ